MSIVYFRAVSRLCIEPIDFPLIIFFVLILVAVFAFAFRKSKWTAALWLSLFISLSIRIYTSSDPFLHDWDEKFHALVAKHLSEHPFTPTLYEHPVRDYDYRDWTANHVWLSKPPIGLWGMALSIRLFGTHEYAVRLPAIIYSLLSVLLVYQIGKSLFNQKTGLIAAMLFGTHGMITDLASGRLSSDGVETCFLFVMNIGWYYLFKQRQKVWSWQQDIILGLVMGAAFLTKWQPSLLLVMIAFFYLVDGKNFWRRCLGASLSIAVAALPVWLWYLYCHIHFPIETDFMMEAMFHPLHIDIANNDATWYTYPTVFGNYFGYTTYLLVVAMAFLVIQKKDRRAAVLLLWILIPFVVFQMAEIKRGTYLMIFAPAVFLIIAHFVQQPFSVKKITWSLVAWISVLFIAGYSIEKLYLFSGKKNPAMIWTKELKGRQVIPGSVINGEPHYIEMMFYHDVTAYPD